MDERNAEQENYVRLEMEMLALSADDEERRRPLPENAKDGKRRKILQMPRRERDARSGYKC